jgi:hypothetical protein
MTFYTMQPLALLEKQHAQIMSELEAIAPEQVKKLRLLDVMIRAAKQGMDKTYAGSRGMISAIELCLNLHEAWMTKDQIASALAAGGYPLAEGTGRMLVGDAVKYHGKTGRLARNEELVGLPEWVGKKHIKRLHDV